MADGEQEQATSVETPAPSPVPAEPSEQVTPAEPEIPSETAAETPAEQPAAPDTETQKQLDDFDKFLASELTQPEAAPATADAGEQVTLSRKDLEAQIFRERQSERDRTKREFDDAAEDRNRNLQTRANFEAQMHGRIRERVTGYVNRGEEIPANFADDVLNEGRQTYYNEGVEIATQVFGEAAFKALKKMDGFDSAPAEVLAPLDRRAKTPDDVMGAVLEVGVALGRLSLEAEVAKRVESESDKKAEVKASVLMKKFLARERANQPNGQLPEARGSSGVITDADFTAHRNDPIGADGKSDWFRANEGQIDAQLRATKK